MKYEDLVKIKFGINGDVENNIYDDENFFKEVKRALNITWDDDDTNASVKDYIKNGATVLQNDVGSYIDFTTDILARKLLKTYCRYERNNSEEDFIDNHLQDILKLEVKYGKENV